MVGGGGEPGGEEVGGGGDRARRDEHREEGAGEGHVGNDRYRGGARPVDGNARCNHSVRVEIRNPTKSVH